MGQTPAGKYFHQMSTHIHVFISFPQARSKQGCDGGCNHSCSKRWNTDVCAIQRRPISSEWWLFFSGRILRKTTCQEHVRKPSLLDSGTKKHPVSRLCIIYPPHEYVAFSVSAHPPFPQHALEPSAAWVFGEPQTDVTLFLGFCCSLLFFPPLRQHFQSLHHRFDLSLRSARTL